MHERSAHARSRLLTHIQVAEQAAGVRLQWSGSAMRHGGGTASQTLERSGRSGHGHAWSVALTWCPSCHDARLARARPYRARYSRQRSSSAVDHRHDGEQWWVMRAVVAERTVGPVRTSAVTAALGPVPFAARRARGSSTWLTSCWRLGLVRWPRRVLYLSFSSPCDPGEADWIPARSIRWSVQESTSISRAVGHAAAKGTKPSLGQPAKSDAFSVGERRTTLVP